MRSISFYNVLNAILDVEDEVWNIVVVQLGVICEQMTLEIMDG